MLHVVTLIGTSERPLGDHDVEQASGALRKLGASVNGHEWLSEREACDIFAENTDEALARENLFLWAEAQKLDVIVQNYQTRRKKALLADMESTIIEQEMLDELAGAAGIRDQVAEITKRAMFGEIDFRVALTERLALLKGLDARIIQQLLGKITLMPGAKELVATLKKHGVRTVLVSGGFTVFAEPVAKKLKFDEFYSNVLSIRDNKIVGLPVDPLLGPEGKLARLKDIAVRLHVPPQDVCAVGDGANDIPMIQAAGLGVAYRAKPLVNEKAVHIIRFANLRALLWAMGYRKTDMA